MYYSYGNYCSLIVLRKHYCNLVSTLVMLFWNWSASRTCFVGPSTRYGELTLHTIIYIVLPGTKLEINTSSNSKLIELRNSCYELANLIAATVYRTKLGKISLSPSENIGTRNIILYSECTTILLGRFIR